VNDKKDRVNKCQESGNRIAPPYILYCFFCFFFLILIFQDQIEVLGGRAMSFVKSWEFGMDQYDAALSHQMKEKTSALFSADEATMIAR
jgi:hypothetical protein